jgi:hypothetical protein
MSKQLRIKTFIKTFFFLFLISYVTYHEAVNKIFISLGNNCECAINLHRKNLIPFGHFPFDFMITKDLTSVAYLIQNNFYKFLDLNSLKFLKETEEPFEHGYHLHIYENQKYNIYFLHDFFKEQPIEMCYNQVREKYDRRIKRLYDLLNSNNHLIFLRTDVSEAQANQFCQIMAQAFPSLSYSLAAINYTDNGSFDWNMCHVYNFSIKKRHYKEWNCPEAQNEWDNIFQYFMKDTHGHQK